MAQGRVDIILKAVDDYSGVLTGLNQGFELTKNVLGTLTSGASMAFNAIKSGAGMAFDGIKEAVDLAVKGGNYQELYNQLSNVAAHFKVDADAVMGTLDDLTDNVISMTDSVRLASKGIAAGFDKEELDTVFTFAKRRTESTGESFEMMAEQIINAMQKGRYTTLADMGLIIEKGMDTAGILAEIERATKQYGDTGFNTGDKIASLANQFDKLLTKIGQGINNSWAWETAMNLIQGSVIDFVNSLDYTAITRFFNGMMVSFTQTVGALDFDMITRSLNGMLNKMANLANSQFMQDILNSMFKGLGDTVDLIEKTDFTSAFEGMGNAIERVVNPIEKVYRGMADLNAITGIFSGTIEIVSETVSGTFDMVMGIIEKNIEAIEDLGTRLGEFTNKFAGIDLFDFSEFTDRIKGVKSEVENLLGIGSEGGGMVFNVDLTSDRLVNQHMQTSQSDAKSVDELFQAVNWPAEFQALGDFMFNWILASASGSPIPMAITTAR